MTEPKVRGRVRIPDGGVMGYREPGGIGLNAEIASDVIRRRQTESRIDERARSLPCVAELIAGGINQRSTSAIDQWQQRQIEYRAHSGVLHLPKSLQTELPALHRIGPREVLKRELHILQAVIGRDIPGFRIGMAPEHRIDGIDEVAGSA